MRVAERRGTRCGAAAALGLVAMLALGACGSSDDGAPRVKSVKELARRISDAGLGCKDLVVSTAPTGATGADSLIGVGTCSISRSSTRAGESAGPRTTWCETEPPLPARRWRCEIGRAPEAAATGGLEGTLGFWVYASDKDASAAAERIARLQCVSRPDASLSLYQARGPNWYAPSQDYRIVSAVTNAIDADLEELPC